MRPGESQDEWKVQVSKTFGKSSRKKKRWKLRSNILMTPWSWKRGNVELHEAMLIKVDVREIISEKVDKRISYENVETAPDMAVGE